MAALAAVPRPDLNGFRLTEPPTGKVYLMLDGLRCWIPNPATYNNLFRDWEHIITDIHIDEIAVGPDLTNGAILAAATGGPVYLITNGQKRHVASPPVMDKYNFAWNRIVTVPPILLDFISTGPQIV